MTTNQPPVPPVVLTGVSDRDVLSFLPGVAEKLGWYVYALRDPRDNVIFYVGKGKGDRVYQHARHATQVAGESILTLKLQRIHSIRECGQQVGVEIIRNCIESSDAAHDIEAAVADAFFLAKVDLTNEIRPPGTEHSWRPLEDIIVRYKAEPVEIANEHRVILIRINRLFHHAITADELYEATRQWWRVDPDHRKPEFAFSVYDGIVRAVYRIDVEGWTRRDDGRRAFTGVADPEMEQQYVWKNVSHYLPTGNQNPIRYINC